MVLKRKCIWNLVTGNKSRYLFGSGGNWAERKFWAEQRILVENICCRDIKHGRVIETKSEHVHGEVEGDG